MVRFNKGVGGAVPYLACFLHLLVQYVYIYICVCVCVFRKRPMSRLGDETSWNPAIGILYGMLTASDALGYIVQIDGAYQGSQR